MLELSILLVLSVSSDSSRYFFSEDDPSFVDPHNKVPSESDLDVSSEDSDFDDLDLQLEWHKKLKDSTGKRKVVGKETCAVGSKKWKSRYDLTRKFQFEWAAKAPWSEALLKDDGLIHQVHCKTCSAVGKKDVVMAPKWDTIFKHGQRDCHKKKTLLYATRRPTTVLEQIQGCNTVESGRKRVQFATLFAILSAGRPMQEYKSREELYQFLNVPECPSMHWCHGSGWLMAEHMYDFIKTK
jgi:hypothetical protein